jgi:hypothetical protein
MTDVIGQATYTIIYLYVSILRKSVLKHKGRLDPSLAERVFSCDTEVSIEGEDV